MPVDMKLLKELRELTGAGVMDCKLALEEANNDINKACEILRKKGFQRAEKYLEKETSVGRIASYVHHGRIGAMVELTCQTDFVALNQEFQELLHDLCLQIAGTNPIAISKEDIPQELVEEEKKRYEDDVKDKPPEIAKRIIEGKLEKNFFSQKCLLHQQFINDIKFKGTVEELIRSKISKFGENITIKRFARFEMGRKPVISEKKDAASK